MILLLLLLLLIIIIIIIIIIKARFILPNILGPESVSISQVRQHGLKDENYTETRIEIVMTYWTYYSEINFDGMSNITSDLSRDNRYTVSNAAIPKQL